MDAQRFDDLTQALTNGATRRRALRLAGGGLAGALLAAVGVGKRAGAQGALEGRPEFAYCVRAHPGVLFSSVAEGDLYNGDALPCGAGPNDCPEGKTCIALVNPIGRIRCRCLEL